MNTQKFKDFVLDCWFDGMTAQQIASSPTAKILYLHGSSRDLTKNAIIGIVNRNGGTFKQGIRKKKGMKKVSFEQLAEDIKQKKLELEIKRQKDKYRKRKCLSCQKESIMEKNIYMCKSCKESYKRYGNVDSYQVHIR
tara:strand:- start:9559 stop:9972 length:414 start_codon:yes stop_codon:yes gene_type:complete